MKKTYVFVKEISHKELREEFVWRSGDGVTSLISEMEDSHVINVTLYLSKKVKELKEFKLPMPEINGKCITVWVEIFKAEIKFRKIK